MIKKISFFIKEKHVELLLMVIVLSFGYFIIKNAYWIFGDDFEFLISTGIGKIEWDYHIGDLGRLFPMAHFDFNILTLIPNGNTPFAHFSLILLKFCFFVLFTYKLFLLILSEFDTKSNLFIKWIIFLSISFLIYFFNYIFLHLCFGHILFVFFPLFFIVLYKFHQTNKLIFGILANTISLYLIFSTENIFVIFFTISFVNIFFNYQNLSKSQKILYYSFFLNIIIFLSIYYFLVYQYTDTFYTRYTSLQEIFVMSTKHLKVLYIALVLLFWRAYKLIIKKETQHIFIDNMLFAGLIYALSNVVLKTPMQFNFYISVLLVLPSIIYWIIKFRYLKLIFIIMILINAYYLRNFPKELIRRQEVRKESRVQLNSMVQLINISDNSWFLKQENADLSIQAQEGYHEMILNIYYNYLNELPEDKTIQIINQLPDIITERTIIFYYTGNEENATLYNETIQKLSTLGFINIEYKYIYGLHIFVNFGNDAKNR